MPIILILTNQVALILTHEHVVHTDLCHVSMSSGNCHKTVYGEINIDEQQTIPKASDIFLCSNKDVPTLNL